MQPLADSASLSPWTPGVFSLLVYTALVLFLMALLLWLTAWAGEKRPSPEKQRPYESGIIPTGPARLRFPVPFYQVAIFFLIFDVEAAFIFAWAVAGKELGWAGWAQITLFIALLLIGLIYIWRKGGLEWGPALKHK